MTTNKNTPSINDFAKTVADAYVNQYHGGSRVMGTPIVYYNTETGKFDWCSSLVPLSDDEIKCETVEDGLYGDTSVGTPDEIRDAIEDVVLQNTTLADLPEACFNSAE